MKKSTGAAGSKLPKYGTLGKLDGLELPPIPSQSIAMTLSN